jgi:rhodanese-related sulfurtransferase
MTYQTTNPAGVQPLLGEGWTYIDIRTVEEFEPSHVTGAYNVPFLQRSPAGQMIPNGDFLASMQKHFNADSKLVIGCAAGGRSKHACDQLASAGYTSLVNMHGGFSGAFDMTGALTEKGWQDCGYECESDCQDGRDWNTLKQ